MALLAAYSFDETGNTVIDYSGNGRSFSISGTDAVRSSTGHTNGGLTGTSSSVVTTLASPAFGQSTDRTVMFWAKGTGEVWYVRWQVNSLDSGSWGILVLSGSLGAQARNASTFVRPSVAVPGDGLWHHYAATYTQSSGVVALYLDGAVANSTTLTGPLRTDADTIDIAEWGTGTFIDDLRIYDDALTTAQIAALMAIPVAAGPIYPVSQYGNFH